MTSLQNQNDKKNSATHKNDTASTYITTSLSVKITIQNPIYHKFDSRPRYYYNLLFISRLYFFKAVGICEMTIKWQIYDAN